MPPTVQSSADHVRVLLQVGHLLERCENGTASRKANSTCTPGSAPAARSGARSARGRSALPSTPPPPRQATTGVRQDCARSRVTTEEARPASPSAPQALDGSATACSTRCAASDGCSSTRSRPSRRRSGSSSGAGSAALRPRRARAAPLGGATALRVERLHLADRGAADDPRPDGEDDARQVHWERRSREFLAQNEKFRRHVLAELESRSAALARDRRPLGRRLGVARLVGRPQRDAAARHPARARRGRGRRPPQQPAALGSRGAVVSGDRRDARGRGRARAGGAPLPHARRPAHEGGRVGGAPGGRGRAGARPRDAPLPLRPADPRPRPRRGALRVSATGSRCTSPRRSGSTATTSCRCS